MTYQLYSYSTTTLQNDPCEQFGMLQINRQMPEIQLCNNYTEPIVEILVLRGLCEKRRYIVGRLDGGIYSLVSQGRQQY